ncbi:hypothetical protein BPOR_0205g00100 [Botrytis porri]|uniref:Uncharacterized protein n=1 Tax=Botrytis porri TaxID=87229 RepID=A0A4Z1KTM0_9HELO|nr:hypothetical protein BPOR_0205g00100 [Botrytis porri]
MSRNERCKSLFRSSQVHDRIKSPKICVQREPIISKGAKEKDETSDMQQNFSTFGLDLAMGTRLGIKGPTTHGSMC